MDADYSGIYEQQWQIYEFLPSVLQPRIEVHAKAVFQSYYFTEKGVAMDHVTVSGMPMPSPGGRPDGSDGSGGAP